MSWTLGRKNPLILMPALSVLPYDWSVETALYGVSTPNYWYTETGTPARSSTRSLFGTYSMAFSGAANQGALCPMDYDTRVWGAKDAGPYAMYCFVYPTASTGTVRIQFDLTQGGNPPIVPASSNYADFTCASMTLNAWNLIRVVSPSITATQLGPTQWGTTNTSCVAIRVSLISSGGADAFWVDGIFWGRALDFQDLYQYQGYSTTAGVTSLTGSGKGAYCISPMKTNTIVPRTVVQADNGAIQAYQWASGRKSIDFKSSIIDNTSVTTVRTFYDYISDKTPVTFFRDQTSITREYIGKAILTNKDDGIDQDKGSPDFQFGWSLKEVI